MKPKHNSVRFRLATIVTVCFGASVSHGAENFWTGSAGTNWNNPANWSLGHLPEKAGLDENAVINTTGPNIATISEANMLVTPRDIYIGSGEGNSGILNHPARDGFTGGGNWFYVGRNRGTGTYNFGGPAAGPGFSGLSQGTGNMNVSGELHVGNSDVGNAIGSGTVNMNTTGTLQVGTQCIIGEATTGTFNLDGGTLQVGNEVWVGQASGGNGTLKMSGGTINNNNWVVVGRSGSTGNVLMTGGTWNKTGDGVFAVGANGNGTFDQVAGDVSSNGQFFVGNDGGSTDSKYLLKGGTVTSGSWTVIGRNAGKGTLDMTGGTFTKNGGGTNFIVGSCPDGPGAVGVMNMSGGLVNVVGGITWIGEQNNAQGTLTMSGTAEFRTSRMTLADRDTAVGKVFLNGGLLLVGQITGGDGATSEFTFNGGQIRATGDQAEFINNLDLANITGATGLKIDTQGFAVASGQVFTGTGGLVKTGSGSLTLNAANFTGPTAVNQGSLTIGSLSTAGGSFSVADDATLQASIQIFGDQIDMDSATLGVTTGADIGIALGTTGNPTLAPINVINNLQNNGETLINLSATSLLSGQFPVISFGSLSGTGTFALGNLPRGVQATAPIVTANSVELNITRAANLFWVGSAVDNTWSAVNNWENGLNSLALTTYADGDPVAFDDNGDFPDVILNAAVAPSIVDFNNSSSTYTLTGTGKITGTTGLTKNNGGEVTIGTLNEYTGVTRIAGGVVNVGTLADGGAPSAIGMSTADPANLVLAGGRLNYTGPATVAPINRGFTIAGNGSAISTVNQLEISGPVVTTGGNLIKSGAGNLILSNPGANVFGTANPGLQVQGGTLTFEGGGTQVNTVGEQMWVGSIPNVDATMIINQGTVNVGSWIGIGRGNGNANALSTFIANDSTIQCNQLGVGHNNGLANLARQQITLNNSDWTNIGQSILSEDGGSTMVFDLTNGSTYTGNTTIHIARNNGSTGTVNVTGGSTFQGNGFITLGRNGGSQGFANVSSGMLIQAGVPQAFIIGEDGAGTLTVSGSGIVRVDGSELRIAPNASATGTVNLNAGGTIIAKRVNEGTANAGNSTFNFDGGTLKAATGADLNFMTGLNAATVKSGGAILDSDGQTIAVNQALLDGTGGGGLTKVGAGTLRLNAANTYTGTTTVSAGILGGTGSVAGPLVVSSGASVNPGSVTGTLSAASATFAAGSTFTVEIDDTQPQAADQLAVTGNLNVTGAALNVAVTGTAAMLPYTIATAGTVTGPFASVPAGVNVSYGANSITITALPAGSPFQTWIGDYPSIPVADRDPLDDPDNDGYSNLEEFALGGDPSSGTNNARIYSIVADGNVDGDANKELLMTIAVRTGTPAFTAGPQPVATTEGITYAIQGSETLGNFMSPVTPVGVVAPAVPAPAGYEFRTFSLDASNGMPSKGFLRVKISN